MVWMLLYSKCTLLSSTVACRKAFDDINFSVHCSIEDSLILHRCCFGTMQQLMMLSTESG